MALYVKNDDVDDLAERLAALKNVSKTEAVRIALQNEWDKEQSADTLVDVGLAFCRKVLARSPSVDLNAADKPFIDALYEED